MQIEISQRESLYAKAFRHYLRTGITCEIDALVSPEGGYPVPSEIEYHIRQGLAELNPLRRLATVSTIAAGSLVVQEPSRAITIPTHALWVQPKAPQILLDEMLIDPLLVTKAYDVLARCEGEAFASGSGINQPRGFLSYAEKGEVEVIRSGRNGAVTAASILDLVYRLPDLDGASFLMNRSTVQEVRMLRDPVTEAYLWQPGLSAGAPDTLAGVPVYLVREIPTPARGSLSVVLGDFSEGYRIVDKPGIRVLRCSFTEESLVVFFTTMGVGGDVVRPEAIKVLRLAA